jgi:hypothetical protein
MKDVTEMLTSELIQEYNALTGKSVEKFSSRVAGEQQVTRARTAAGLDTNVVPEIRLETHKPAEDVNLVRAAGARRSWDNIDTFNKRRQRTNVSVEGKGEFRSVAAAFKALELPMARHIPFRADLKKAGTLEIEGMKFSVVRTTEGAQPRPPKPPKAPKAPKAPKVVNAEAAE